MSKPPPARIPTLTDVACPGETLRALGLWLPINPVPELQAETGDNWRSRLPPDLRGRADIMLKQVRDRAQDAADAALAGSAPPPAARKPRR